jgi:RsiW-degrading membrane proteinase PrsW (M82 family)
MFCFSYNDKYDIINAKEGVYMLPMIVIILFAIIFLGLMFILNKGKNNIKHYLLIAVIGGIISAFACLFVEQFSGFLLDTFFSEFYYYKNGYLYFETYLSMFLYSFIDCLILTGLVEEGVKYLTVFSLTEKNQHRLYTYLECVIPIILIGVVFAVIEDYLYIFEYETSGWIRASIFFGGHNAWSMLFGYFYYRYRVRTEVNNLYYQAKKKGIKLRYKMLNKRKPIYIGMLIVVLMHGIYNFISYHFLAINVLKGILNVGLFVVLLIYTISSRKKNAKKDALKYFVKMYPEYTEEQLKEMEIV